MFNIINFAALFRLWIRIRGVPWCIGYPKDALIIFIFPCKQECHIEGGQLCRFIM